MTFSLRPTLATFRRMLKTGLLVMALMMSVMATPANAWVEESGTWSCGGQFVHIRSNSFGSTWHFRDTTSVAYWYLQNWAIKTSSTGVTATPWAVGVSGGALNGVGTYAYCAGGPG